MKQYLNGELVDFVPPVLAAEDRAAAYTEAVRRHLDAVAAERRYDSIQTAVTYRDDPNPQFAAEGQALFAWRSAVWSAAIAIIDAVMAGDREPPTVEDMLGELPAFVWP